MQGGRMNRQLLLPHVAASPVVRMIQGNGVYLTAALSKERTEQKHPLRLH